MSDSDPYRHEGLRLCERPYASPSAVAFLELASPQFMKPSAARPLGTAPERATCLDYLSVVERPLDAAVTTRGQPDGSLLEGVEQVRPRLQPHEPTIGPSAQTRSEMPRAREVKTSHALSARTVDVMVVDSRAVMREGLRAVIEQEPDLVVVAQAATVRHARSPDIAPDVIVTDIDLPDAKYSDAISGLREFFPQSPILVFTSIDDPAEVQAVLNAGANGYILETAEHTDLLAAIRAVAGGETYLQPSLGVELARSHRSPDTRLGLSTQEERILRLLVLGHTNTDIARLCNISLRTAETHRAHIQRKLDRHTRAELVQYARENGLIQLDP